MSRFNSNKGNDKELTKKVDDVTAALAEIESKKANLSDLNISSTPNEVKYDAHRGVSAIAPENTIPAIEIAGRLGYYGVEIDIRPTKDGKFVLIHDPDINTMTNGSGLVKDLTLAEIQNYNVNKGSNIAKYPDLKLATLEECLAICKKYGMRCLIELKDYYLTEHPAMLIDVIVKMGMESQVEVMYYWETWVAREIRRLNKKIKVAIIAATFSQANLDLAISLGNSVMSIEYYNLTKEDIEKCHRNNIPVSTYTVNTLNVAQNMIKNGVDFITTDHLL